MAERCLVQKISGVRQIHLSEPLFLITKCCSRHRDYRIAKIRERESHQVWEHYSEIR